MADSYQEALRQALEDLKLMDDLAERTERRRAQLRQIIAGLQSLMSAGSARTEDQSLTSAILDIVKAAEGHITASEVLERLDTAGYIANAPTVATLLSRLVKEAQLEKGDGGYRWAGVPKWAEEFGKGMAEAMLKVGTDEEVLPIPIPAIPRRTLRRRL